ncbi:MAG: hypothetical protein AAFO75_01850 [Pseudomonadota bacterium]
MAYGHRGQDGIGPEPGHGFDPGSYDRADWYPSEQPPRDWKKAVLVIGLGALSWVATFVGMLELIESNMGTLPLQHRLIIACAVAMLMIMIIWLLDQLFSPAPFGRKVAYAGGYLFLTVISVGFGFGFYWKVLESRSEATRSAQSAVGQVQSAMFAGSTRLEQLNATLISLTDLSQKKAAEEREFGTSCPNSRPGDGPRRKLRDADAEKFSFASQFVGGRIEGLKTELASFETHLKKVSEDDPSTISQKDGTRNEFMRGLGRKLDLSVAGFNAFRTDPQLQQIRQDLSARAEKTIFPTAKGGTFSCPDQQLQAALRGVVRAIDQLPELQQPKIAAVEGSEATIEAFRRLTTTLVGLASLELPPTPEELRSLQRQAVQSASNQGAAQASLDVPAAGLAKRDYIPLALAIFVDLCLLLVSMGRPMNRFGGLVDKMREAEKGPVIRILSRFNDIHRDAEVRQNFEVFRHVVFDYHGAYYVAVPLDTPYNRVDPRSGQALHYGANDAQDLQHEAHLLSNLFASFEKEKIFSRVYSPLLTTGMIQKRLARQGSKFSGCRAFRLYRFKDGAWSDIILGAVMGAARRVEEEKVRTGRVSATAGRVSPSDLPGQTREDAHGQPHRGAGSQVREGMEENRMARAGGSQPLSADLQTPRRTAPWQTDHVDAAYASRDRHNGSPASGAFQSQFGSYAASAKAELYSDESKHAPDHTPANNNTQPTGASGARSTNGHDGNAQVISLPQRPASPVRSDVEQIVEPSAGMTKAWAPAASAVATEATVLTSVPPPVPSPDSEQAVEVHSIAANETLKADTTEVTLMRETATFTLPASEADLPRDLLRTASRASVSSTAPQTPDRITALGQDRASTIEPVEVADIDLETDDEAFSAHDFIEDDARDDDVIRTIAQRLRPNHGQSNR